MGCGVVEPIPGGSTQLTHLFFRGRENNHILAVVIQGKPSTCLYQHVQDEGKKKENLKKEINYLSSINIKENCKT